MKLSPKQRGFPQTWVTNEVPQRILTVKGYSALDQDCLVAKDEGTGKSHWIVESSGAVCGLPIGVRAFVTLSTDTTKGNP